MYVNEADFFMSKYENILKELKELLPGFEANIIGHMHIALQGYRYLLIEKYQDTEDPELKKKIPHAIRLSNNLSDLITMSKDLFAVGLLIDKDGNLKERGC